MTILIIGLGSIAKKHISAIRELMDEVSVFALRSNKNSQPIEGVTNIYNISDLPSKPDFAIISNPTSLHFTTIRDMCEYGCPMFIEKPVLSTIEGSEEISMLLSAYPLMTYVACNLRFHPLIKRLKTEFALRKPIEMSVYCGSYLPDWRPGQDYRKVYSAHQSMGGGVHLDLIHEVDYVKYLLGLPIHSQVYRSRKSNLEIDSSDVAHYLLEYDQTSVFITLNYYRKDPKRGIECVWENETWSVDLLNGAITDHLGNEVFTTNYPIVQTYKDQMSYFIDCLKSGNSAMNDFNEAVEVLKICLS